LARFIFSNFAELKHFCIFGSRLSHPLSFSSPTPDILQEHTSHKQTPHRSGRGVLESPLPEISEKMTLQAGQISNLQQNFGSIQQEIKKVEESIMRLSTTLVAPAEPNHPPSFHGYGRVSSALLCKALIPSNQALSPQQPNSKMLTTKP